MRHTQTMSFCLLHVWKDNSGEKLAIEDWGAKYEDNGTDIFRQFSLSSAVYLTSYLKQSSQLQLFSIIHHSFTFRYLSSLQTVKLTKNRPGFCTKESRFSCRTAILSLFFPSRIRSTGALTKSRMCYQRDPRQPPPNTYTLTLPLKGLGGFAPYGSNPLAGTFRPTYVNTDVINVSACDSF